MQLPSLIQAWVRLQHPPLSSRAGLLISLSPESTIHDRGHWTVSPSEGYGCPILASHPGWTTVGCPRVEVGEHWHAIVAGDDVTRTSCVHLHGAIQHPQLH